MAASANRSLYSGPLSLSLPVFKPRLLRKNVDFSNRQVGSQLVKSFKALLK